MSAGELHGGYQPGASRRSRTRSQRMVDFALGLWLVGCLVCQFYFPGVWVGLMGAPFVVLGVIAWMLPRRFRHYEDEDWEARLTPPRRLILQLITVLFIGSYLADLSLSWTHGFDGERTGIVLLAWLAMGAVGALAWPRNPEWEIDLRPVWAICSLIFAAFFYIMFTN